MKHEFRYKVNWPNGEANDHTINLDLDVTISDILRSNRNIKERLIADEQGIRAEIFRMVAEEIVPQIIEGTLVDTNQPIEHIKSSSKYKMHNESEVGVPTRSDTSLFIRNRMRMVLDINTNHPVNAIQALHASRGGVAAEITTSIMRHLKKVVLKESEEDTTQDWKLSGNRVESFKHKVNKSSRDKN